MVWGAPEAGMCVCVSGGVLGGGRGGWVWGGGVLAGRWQLEGGGGWGGGRWGWRLYLVKVNRSTR